MKPNKLFFAGLLLVVAGAVFPFLMVIRVLPASMWLSFVSYFCSVTGLFLGLISAATMYSERRSKKDLDR